jgi:GDPmannose 4,6-dehydratase
VKIDSRYFRPTEVDILLGDASKAHRELGWKHTVRFPELVSEMVSADLKAVAEESKARDRHHD